MVVILCSLYKEGYLIEVAYQVRVIVNNDKFLSHKIQFVGRTEVYIELN